MLFRSLAPPRETLRQFGGPYTIETFRAKVKQRCTVMISLPPVNAVQSKPEEIVLDMLYPPPKKKTSRQDAALRANSSGSTITLNSSRVQKASDELRLRRTKKKNTENTLEQFMQLKIA